MNEITTELKAYQTEGNEIRLELNTDTSLKNPVITLTDLSGKIITTHTPGALNEGKHSISLKGNFQPGLHLITVQEAKYNRSIKLILH